MGLKTLPFFIKERSKYFEGVIKMRIGTSISTKKLDQACVEEYKIPLIVMMENAVLSAVKHLAGWKHPSLHLLHRPHQPFRRPCCAVPAGYPHQKWSPHPGQPLPDAPAPYRYQCSSGSVRYNCRFRHFQTG